MKYINNQNLKALLLSAMTLTLAACGGSTSDKIVDRIDTSYSASIAYINATDNSSTFFTKSTVYNEDLFSNRFNIVEVMRNESSARYTHEWISGANGTLFGAENAITTQDRVSDNIDLDDGENYWVVATNGSTPKLNILERKQSDNTSTYNVRVFSTKAVDITIVGTEGVVKRTEPDTATTFFNLENCSDLYVENNLINVCQDGNVGASYIAIVDENGQLALARE
jgi:hypothetical protein